MAQTILIADDEANILVSLEYLIQREGYNVVVAHDGQQALAALDRQVPDLVLLDVMMPGKSGLEVCQHIRASARLRGVRVLMLTAKGRDIDIAKGLALGADAYITKPFSTRELVAKIESMLGTGA